MTSTGFGISFAEIRFQEERKEVKQMKKVQAFLAALILVGTTGIGTALAADDGVIFKEPLTLGSYCHEKFPAMKSGSLDDNKPTLKSPSSGDEVDFYGPCNESPTGKDQQNEQKLDFEHRMDNDYD
jgi:hypothetical protein